MNNNNNTSIDLSSTLLNIRSELISINNLLAQTMSLSRSTTTISAAYSSSRGVLKRELRILYNDTIALKGKIMVLIYQYMTSPYNANLDDVRDSCEALVAYIQHCNHLL
ncbi:hypothetical protein ABK040_006367 [Willaertia magna]